MSKHIKKNSPVYGGVEVFVTPRGEKEQRIWKFDWCGETITEVIEGILEANIDVHHATAYLWRWAGTQGAEESMIVVDTKAFTDFARFLDWLSYRPEFAGFDD